MKKWRSMLESDFLWSPHRWRTTTKRVKAKSTQKETDWMSEHQSGILEIEISNAEVVCWSERYRLI